MTLQAGSIRILRERAITTTPSVGEESRLIAITFQIPPLPPNVVFIEEKDLPDRMFLIDNPDAEEVPDAIQKEGDAIRRLNIQQRVVRDPRTQPRTI